MEGETEPWFPSGPTNMAEVHCSAAVATLVYIAESVLQMTVVQS
jgi:hypothetical protein